MINIVIDFGNSLIKIGFFKNGELVDVLVSSKVLQIIKKVKSLASTCEKLNLILSGSAPSKIKQLLNKFDWQTFFQEKKIEGNLFILNKDIITSLKIDDSWKKEIGMDLYAIASYVSSFNKNNLTILMGTANVALYVSKKNKLIDVVISPGLGISNSVFRKKAELISPEEGLMSVTDNALLKGQHFLAKGFLNEAIKKGKDIFKKENFEVLISGGDSSILKNELSKSNKNTFINSLTLKSYYYLFESFCSDIKNTK